MPLDLRAISDRDLMADPALANVLNLPRAARNWRNSLHINARVLTDDSGAGSAKPRILSTVRKSGKAVHRYYVDTQ